MKQLAILLVSLFCLGPLARAESAPRKVLDKQLVLTTTVLAAGTVADIETTAHALQNCSSCYEANSLLYGTRPSRARMYAIGAAYDGAMFGVTYWLKANCTAGWKCAVLWRTPALAVAGLRGYFAFHNATLRY